MPKKSKHPCGYPGCPQLVDAGQRYCEKHKQPDRPSAAKRGYNSKWRRLSKVYLRKHPMCVRCLQQGRYVPATVVDHIIPHRGTPALMWDESNWQALCKPCHDKKTGNEDSRPVYSYQIQVSPKTTILLGENSPGGIKIPKNRQNIDRWPLSRTKTGIQTPYCPLRDKNTEKHR